MPRVKRAADLDGPDYFPTPPEGTYGLLEKEEFIGAIWEPACGDGAMAGVLKTTGNPVLSSDLFDRGYGEIGHDFLTTDRVCDNIVTNPPYHSAKGFVQVGLKHARRKLALLLRLPFLEGVDRYRTIYGRTPPNRIWQFSDRLTIYRAGVQRRGKGTTPYAWFIWDREAPCLPNETKFGFIEPGVRKRYSRHCTPLISRSELSAPDRRQLSLAL